MGNEKRVIAIRLDKMTIEQLRQDAGGESLSGHVRQLVREHRDCPGPKAG